MKNSSFFSPWCVWSVPNGFARLRYTEAPGNFNSRVLLRPGGNPNAEYLGAVTREAQWDAAEMSEVYYRSPNRTVTLCFIYIDPQV